MIGLWSICNQIVVYIYSFFIEWDAHAMSTLCKQVKINQTEKIHQLGKIQHVFLSKNQVLSSNQLVFKMCSVGENVYGAEE